MKINGTDYAGTLTCGEGMHIDLELLSATGLVVGLAVDIEDEGVVYFGRSITAIEGNHVECDSNQIASTDYEESLRKLGMDI